MKDDRLSALGAETSTQGGTHARAPPVGTESPGIAFFDFDNTLMRGDAGPLFGWYLFRWRRHELAGHPWKRLRVWLRFFGFATIMGVHGVVYKLRAKRRSNFVRAAYKGLGGVSVKLFLGLMDDFADEVIIPRLYPVMVAEIKRHIAEGRRCVVVTTGMEVLVRRVLDRIDLRIELIGCRLMQADGRLTGRVDGPLYGQDKANIMHAYVRALGERADACWAYSDHFSDRHMLEAVGHPVAVDPTGRLLRLAERRGWAILATGASG